MQAVPHDDFEGVRQRHFVGRRRIGFQDDLVLGVIIVEGGGKLDEIGRNVMRLVFLRGTLDDFGETVEKLFEG